MRLLRRKEGGEKLDLICLFILGLLVRLGLATIVSRPGYMDTAYYAAGAVRLAQGGGLSELFIWNYLDSPASIPHPGFLYWMPLPSLLGAPFGALFPGSFLALQIPFLILSSLVPLVAYDLAARAIGRRTLARAAGLLTVFSGFFFPYWTLPETFAPFALFGGTALWLAGRRGSRTASNRTVTGRWLLVGLLVGSAHLTRADGVLLLPVVALAPLVAGRMRRSIDSGYAVDAKASPSRRKAGAVRLLLIGTGYLLTMSPWFVRNLATVGTPLPSAGTRTIWLTEYDDLFCYDCDLSASSYLAWGWSNILRSKLSALWINFQRFLAEDCLIFLLPFTAIGLYRLRRRLSFLLASIYLIGIYLAHSLVFTFPGWRGGFFHASSAVLPFLYTAGMKGLDTAIRWSAQRRRGWRYQQALPVFVTAAIMAAVLLSGYTAWQRIPAWRQSSILYAKVDRCLRDRGTPTAGVMVRNPPAFWYHTERPAAVIPNEDVDTLLVVADRYEMDYVLLEEDHPAPLADLYTGNASHPRLRPVEAWSNVDSILYAVQR